ncbi:hypothetical protein Fot_42261 [Forsythia ovata]|uniref:Uncharacterized protein n=1 Tax=Forsythia ovata TaxID=205694 RepID=A0ABD1RLM9_9LAMI
MARTKTTTHHPEVRRSRRGTAAAPLVTTPPPTPFILSLPSTVPCLLPPPVVSLSRTIPSISVPQPSAASEGPFTAAISTQVRRSLMRTRVLIMELGLNLVANPRIV